MEKAGKPAVGIVSAGFEQTAKATAKAFGLPEFRYARVNHVLTGLTPPQIEHEVTEALERIIEVLTTQAAEAGGTAATPHIKPAEVLQFDALDA
jgi:hypothetical protein